MRTADFARYHFEIKVQYVPVVSQGIVPGREERKNGNTGKTFVFQDHVAMESLSISRNLAFLAVRMA